MTARIQLRRGTAAEWAAENPVLADGESGFERDTGLVRVGDGLTSWNNLRPLRSRQSQQFGGRIYCYPNNRWIYPSHSYGLAAENWAQNGGAGADPTVSYAAVGLPVRNGQTVEGVSLFGRTSHADITSMEFRLYFQTGPWGGTWDSNGETVRQIVCGQTDLFPVAVDMQRYRIPADFTADDDGFLIPMLKPVGVIASTRYCYIQGLIDLLI